MGGIDPELTADEEEASEMIEKARELTKNGQGELCVIHTQMLVWMMRRMLKEKRGLGVLALERLPWPVTVLLGLLYLVLAGLGVVKIPGV
jgi:hypothetical protein